MTHGQTAVQTVNGAACLAVIATREVVPVTQLTITLLHSQYTLAVASSDIQ